MRTLALTAALITATLSTTAIAADWVYVDENVSGDVIFIDSTSIRTMPSGYKRAWIMSFYANPLVNSNGPDRSVVLKEYDCREGKSRELQSTFFKGEKVVEINTAPMNWSYASPGSLHEGEVNYVCFGKLLN